jgi:hypothetical protein
MIHLWRSYQIEPYDRFAMTIEHDPKAEYGFRIVDHDPAVADASFTVAFSEHMRRPTTVQFVNANGEEGYHWEYPGSPKHTSAAARTFDRATVCGKGRK